MLVNHAPLMVAERFKVLEALFPGRIDLGLGRAHINRATGAVAFDAQGRNILLMFGARKPGKPELETDAPSLSMGRCSVSIIGSEQSSTARSMTFLSSRMLPGYE